MGATCSTSVPSSVAVGVTHQPVATPSVACETRFAQDETKPSHQRHQTQQQQPGETIANAVGPGDCGGNHVVVHDVPELKVHSGSSQPHRKGPTTRIPPPGTVFHSSLVPSACNEPQANEVPHTSHETLPVVDPNDSYSFTAASSKDWLAAPIPLLSLPRATAPRVAGERQPCCGSTSPAQRASVSRSSTSVEWSLQATAAVFEQQRLSAIPLFESVTAASESVSTIAWKESPRLPCI